MSEAKQPIQILLDAVEWKETGSDPNPEDDSMPYATHEGVLEMMGHKFRVVQLNTGQRVFDAEDVERFFLGEHP